MWLAKNKLKVVLGIAAAVVVGNVVWLGMFPPQASRIFMNHHRAIISVRQLCAAERTYAARHTELGFACDLRKLAEEPPDSPDDTGLIDSVLASGRKSGYRFALVCPDHPDEKKIQQYLVTAVPEQPGLVGKWAFCTDQRGEIWYSQNGSASECLHLQKPWSGKYE